MTPGVLNLNYLSFYLAKIQKQVQFWNPQNKQISKLPLLFKFCEDLMEILPKTKSINSSWGCPKINFCSQITVFSVMIAA